MTTHTPGPWTVAIEYGQHAVVAGDKVIAFTGRMGAMDDAESEANARLIASAPTLLKLLERVLDERQDAANALRAFFEASVIVNKVNGFE